jgi:2-polyprenyl-3-methyl-5-hydroxy-6-metoxy-1,4-benzoquinol methylase
MMDSTKHLVMGEKHMDDLYKSWNPLVRWVHVKRIKNTAGIVPEKAKKILDVGCGEGHLLKHLERDGRELHGIDALKHVVRQAERMVPNAKIVLGDGMSLPYPDGYFDAVTCIDVLEHVPNWRAVVSEIMRVTRRKGSVVLGWPNDDNWNFGRLLLGKGPVPDHINVLTPRIMRQAVNRQPLTIKRIPFGMPWKLCLTTQELYIK